MKNIERETERKDYFSINDIKTIIGDYIKCIHEEIDLSMIEGGINEYDLRNKIAARITAKTLLHIFIQESGVEND